ncbi:MAG: RsmE family RNA methyltransferase [bacterium]
MNRRGFFTTLPDPVTIPSRCVVSLGSAPWPPRLGEIITVGDDRGRHYRGRVERISGHWCEVHLFDRLARPMDSSLDLLLLQALPDKERMEWIIQKSTELGVTGIVPFYSQRSIRLEEREARQPKAHRWPRVARRASQQCRRPGVPVIAPYTDFSSALRHAEGFDLKLVLWEGEHEIGLKGICPGGERPSRISVLVGPEGGLTDEEVGLARESGFVSIGLGPRILRTETAAIGIVAVIQFLWGDLG